MKGERKDLICPECGAGMKLRQSKYGPFYGCVTFPKCHSSHGAHPDGAPLGIPADGPTKLARIRAHAAFDPLWEGLPGSRRKAKETGYRWLADQLGIRRDDCHMGGFDEATCNRVVEICEQNGSELGAIE